MRTNTHERYVREWLAAMANAGYLEYDPASRWYTFPAEHAPVPRKRVRVLRSCTRRVCRAALVVRTLLGHMRSGGGLGLEAYPDSMYGGIDRFTAGWFENLLILV